MSSMQSNGDEHDLMRLFDIEHANAVKVRDELMGKIQNWKDGKTPHDGYVQLRRLTRQVWGHELLKAWLNPVRQDNTENILVVIGELEHDNFLLSELSYALAGLANFLDRETCCLTLSYTVSAHKDHNKNGWDDDWNDIGPHALFSLIAQLVA